MRSRMLPAAVTAAALVAVRAGHAQPDYHRADQVRIAPSRIQGVPEIPGFFGLLSPNWFADSSRMWCRVATPRGAEFVVVDAVKGTRGLLFDNARLAAALSVAGDTAFDPGNLPFRTFKLVDQDTAIAFRVGAARYQCVPATHRCLKGDTLTTEPPDHAVISPDRQWAAYVRKGNLWVRRIALPRDSIQLTTDGAAEFGYGLPSPDRPMPDADTRPPQLVWSPNSKRIAILKFDDRGVTRLAVYSSTGTVPKLFQYPMAVPSDSVVPTAELHLIDVSTKANVTVSGDRLVADVFGWTGVGAVQWTQAADRVYYTDPKRANKGVTLRTADAVTGASRAVLSDSTATFIENASGVSTGNWRLVGDREILWWSERDGWGHLYRYDVDGKLLNQVTRGPWLVQWLKHVDVAGRQIFFTALGRDSANPYFARVMRVGFDGSGLTDLTPGGGGHLALFPAGGRHFVDIESRPERAPITTLRLALDGRKVLDLERGDPTEMAKGGWTPPVPFTVKARDGLTDLYGFLYLPSRMDTTAKYPVVVHIYPGPQVGTIIDYGFNRSGEPRGLAELGFVVVQVNALGTPGRSKAFHDAYYGNMADNGIPDQIAATKQLAARFRFMDLDRVGIYGHSGGGFSSTGAILRYPDFFKVAVSGSGNHDNRSYRADWGEKYQGRFKRDAAGRDNFESQANYLLAGNLKGRLFLMTGDMDTNVHPAMTYRLVDALIKAGKDFDMLVIPDAEHGLPDYSIKKRWDYFVRWLRHEAPPVDYRMVPCPDPLSCLY